MRSASGTPASPITASKNRRGSVGGPPASACKRAGPAPGWVVWAAKAPAPTPAPTPPLLGAGPYPDPSYARWLHVHVRPSVKGLLRVLRTIATRKAGTLQVRRRR